MHAQSAAESVISQTIMPPPPPYPPLTTLPYTQGNWRTLMAIMDTIVASIRRESHDGDNTDHLIISDAEYLATSKHLRDSVVHAPCEADLDKFLDEQPSKNPAFRDLMARSLALNAHENMRKAIGYMLTALNTRVGCLLLTSCSTPFHLQPIEARTKVLRAWRDSYLRPLVAFYSGMLKLGESAWIKTSPLFSPLSGFPAVPSNYRQGKHYDYEFIQFPAGPGAHMIETDVVIVGSGCGGAVCAKNLAEAGFQVLVVEKSYYYPPSQLPMNMRDAAIHLFENGGNSVSDDSSISVVAGSCWGGGGTVNWSASLQTQGFVRREWAHDRGLTFFETAEFQTCLDRVCHRMGVTTDNTKHNHGNQVLLEGSRKLGYHAKAVPQNARGAEHFCGHCTLGCAAAEKQGPVVSWLADAAQAGAKFIEGFDVVNIIFDEATGLKKAVGIRGMWTSRSDSSGNDGAMSEPTIREVIVRAKKVIISAGALWSPIILLRSGLNNYQIGRNLKLHPVNLVSAEYAADVRPWEGSILTAVCTSFENLDGHGHGSKLEALCMLPSFFLPLLPWSSGLECKTRVLKYRHMNGFISITRDRDSGRVWLDPKSGRSRITYTPSAFDRAHGLQGILALARICYVTGAREIHVSINGIDPFIRSEDEIVVTDAESGITNPRFLAWLASIEKMGNGPTKAIFASAHQMGTCRMSVRDSDGVVDPKGSVWGTEDLWIADASVFPSASGVNPMITIMAIADWISRNIARELGGQQRLSRL